MASSVFIVGEVHRLDRRAAARHASERRDHGHAKRDYRTTQASLVHAPQCALLLAHRHVSAPSYARGVLRDNGSPRSSRDALARLPVCSAGPYHVHVHAVDRGTFVAIAKAMDRLRAVPRRSRISISPWRTRRS
jgi:hypothetical protein